MEPAANVWSWNRRMAMSYRDQLKPGAGTPSYGGRLEILDTEEGLVLVNEIELEEYLKKVIPSEMPSSYERRH